MNFQPTFFAHFSVALLTIYDMVKAIYRGMIIADIRLLEKSGVLNSTQI